MAVVVLSHSAVSNSFGTPWTIVHQAPLSMEFPRQEYWSALSFPTPGDLPDLGIKPVSPASPGLAGIFFTSVRPGRPKCPYTMEHFSPIKKNEIMPFAAKWIDLETVILSEVSWRKTNTI